MAREIINIVPFWWLIIFTMVFFMIISYVAAHISTYFFHKPIDKDHRDLANTLIGILSGGFSILLAFVIINTWNYLLEAKNATSKEADYLALIVRNSNVFPEDAKNKITQAAGDYAVAVRVNEWKKMRHGKESPLAWQAIENLYQTIQSINPDSDHDKYYYNQILIDVNELLKARRERLNELSSIIPPPLREALIAGSILLAIILGAIRGEGNFFYLMPVLLFSLVLGFNLALALNFDYPFSGEIAVSNQIFYSGALSQFSD
ncbi:hypothetical protein BN59_00358 [Legionella massiliensis]|uniref:DUF4239 domain-containing protein n=1 Tax=Legionella massiliensis TaxID=1034943 RepID=A0A078KWG5_9GAMM|nr:DUF4239 domain-containing protein [Legionella massiliensis]CDZ76094.1 hypothetical protein BN59_00358 [Legionella massiliensis]CEE11832.1 hypothetical protein BN1094_00358 [Legionella massiliensis]